MTRFTVPEGDWPGLDPGTDLMLWCDRCGATILFSYEVLESYAADDDPHAVVHWAVQTVEHDLRLHRPCSRCATPRERCRTGTDPFLSCCPACAAADGDTHRDTPDTSIE